MQYFLLFVSTFFSQIRGKIAFMCKIFVQISTFFSACSAAKSPVTIALFLIITLFSEPSLANPTQNPNTKAQNPKFHKPETEAERALDEILRVETGLEQNSKLNDEDMFTKGFINECKRKQNEALNSQECKEECNGYPCGIVCYPFHKNCIIRGNDNSTVGYVFHTSYQNEQEAFVSEIWYECTQRDQESYQKATTESIRLPYIMKKEDGKWKIDGFCYENINCPTQTN
ncbi:hypothetical protein [Candidatus Deianiraea vastatrix]|uniref:Uncharacterized protein n=1 Tax=Candidatus Deianiraea vastatrix TaxID=2163644 RepID=A0A5B8XEV3_9RICK|nr:hypothetical protein [Candidatus Deianiraea vastatrix]QED23838.1 hypothetical protein Deia_01056 [Candidatus Deianiraea vastatrix]